MDQVQLQIALQDSRFASFVSSNDAEGAFALGNQAGDPIVNTELQTIAAMVKAIGKDNTRIVMATMKAAGEVDPLIDGFRIKLCAIGQEFDDPDWQAAIDTMAIVGNWNPDQITTPLKQMGVKPQTIWQNLGIDPAPTVDEVAAGMAAIPGLRIHNALVTAWTRTSNAEANGQFATVQDAADFFIQAMHS